MIEYKSFAAGDVGPNIDEPAVHCARIDAPEDDLLVAEVEKLVPLLRSCGYRGYFDLNFIVDSARRAWALEPDCRFPLPAAFAFLAEADLGAILLALVRGEELPWQPSRHVLVAAALHIGFPFCGDLPAQFNRRPLPGLQRNPKAFPASLSAFDAKSGEWLVSSQNGYLFGCVGAGETVALARADLRRTFDSVRNPFIYYRTDVGARTPPPWLAW